jgi:YD repeat-containing protein
VAEEPLTSDVELYSGAVIETHKLPTYQSMGETRGVQLVYDSLRADARPIFEIDLNSSNAPGTFIPEQLRLTAELKIYIDGVEYIVPGYADGGITSTDIPFLGADGKHFWQLPEGLGPINAKLQADLREFDTGVYSFSMTAGIQAAAPRTISVVVKKSDGSEETVEKSVVRLTGTVSNPTNGNNTLVHVNSVNSDFGSGWGLAGVKKIVEGHNGSALLIDGDGSEQLFEAPAQEGGEYKSPPGHFLTLTKVEDGTFQLITKQKSVYHFDSQNNLISVVDRNGNTTRHIYTDGRLVKIIDPALLETTLTYNSKGKVYAIVDPAGRTTQLSYDARGNLTQVIDSDNTKRTFEYDKAHHMTSEVDKNNRREEADYDFAGRVTSATRKDGSTLEVKPIQTQGLYRPEETAARYTQAVASRQREVSSSRYVDGNGHVKTSLLDQAGQVISTADEVGQLSGVVQRNNQNLVARTTDARGFATNYQYDAFGNLTGISDSLSRSVVNLHLDDSNTRNLPDLTAIADLNGNGFDDIITVDDGMISILFSQGDRSFIKSEDYAILGDGRDILTEDIDLDGDKDILVSSVEQLTVLINNGLGQFNQINRAITDEDKYSLKGMKVFDIDGDDESDLLANDVWFKGIGDGTFSTDKNGFSDTIYRDFNSAAFKVLNPNPETSAVSDFDNDGDIDVVSIGYGNYSPLEAGANQNVIRVLINQGNGNWQNDSALNIEVPFEGQIAAYDLDEDQDVDIVWLNDKDSILAYLNDGYGAFSLAARAISF